MRSFFYEDLQNSNKQDLRHCHKQKVVGDTTSFIITLKIDLSVTHPTRKMCQLRKSLYQFCMRLRLIALTLAMVGLPKQSPPLGGLNSAHLYKEMVLLITYYLLLSRHRYDNCLTGYDITPDFYL